MDMLHARRVIVCASVALAEIAICAAPSAAQSVAEFYKGKTIAILMGTQPGGSYDLYGRVIGEHLSRYIPGNPTIIMEHMPGAGGVVAGNHLYGPGPQDGTKILLSHSIPLAERLSRRACVSSRPNSNGSVPSTPSRIRWRSGTARR
jgi:tripartite-type tricarboxylate transporter receptor subunit TctC